MKDEIEQVEVDSKTIRMWQLATGIAILATCYFAFTPINEPVVPKRTIEAHLVQEHKATEPAPLEEPKEYKPKSIRENLARAKQVMSGFKEKEGEEPMDRITRMNKYVLEATKEDVKYPQEK